jgi:hypothetical protein
MRHRLGRGVVGLVAGLAAICLLSLPASANTKYLEFVNITGTTPGAITIFNEDGDAVVSIAIPGPAGLKCSTDPTFSTPIAATLAGATTGTIAITMNNRCNPFVAGGINWCSYHNVTMTGTYTATKTYSSASAINEVLRKNVTGTPHNCHNVNSGPWCNIVTTGISVSGIITSSAALPTLTNSDTITINGSSATGTVVVTGTPTTCGIFIAANGGSFSINGRFHVVH